MQPERRLKAGIRQGGLPYWATRPALEWNPCRYQLQSDKSIVYYILAFVFGYCMAVSEPLSAGPNQYPGFLACPTQSGGARAPLSLICD
jgi:hypothetical protein